MDKIKKHFPTIEHFLKNLNPSVASQRYANMNTTRKCLQKKGLLKLSEMKHIYNNQAPVLMLEAWLYNLNDSLNIETKMNEEQIRETALLIYEDYYYLNLAEVNLVFKKIKKGQLGEIYNRLDVSVILRFLERYRQDRIKVVANIIQESEKANLIPINYSEHCKRVDVLSRKKNVSDKTNFIKGCSFCGKPVNKWKYVCDKCHDLAVEQNKSPGKPGAPTT